MAAHNDIVERAIQQSIRNKVGAFDMEEFKLNQLLLYYYADRIDSKATDMISQMKQIGIFRFDDKKTITTIKHNAASLVADLDRSCTEEYACAFGEMADELDAIITDYLSKRKTLQHKKDAEHSKKGKEVGEEWGL